MSLRTVEPPAAPADVEAAIEALRGQGLPMLDPAGFHYLNTLARRASGLTGPARRYLDGRLAQEMFAARSRLKAATTTTTTTATAAQCTADALRTHGAAAQDVAPLSPLALLTRELRALQETPEPGVPTASPHAGDELSARRAPAGELRALRAFKSTWAHLRDEQRLAQALAAVPPNAGPLNTQRLVLRALQHMRQLSPGYFHRFVSHLETLQWLQQDPLLRDDDQRPAPGTASRPGARASKPRPKRR